MDIMKALNKMDKLERKAAELYRYYHTLFYNDKEASEFYYSMYLEEMGHSLVINYARNLVRQNPTIFKDVNIDSYDFDKIEKRIDEALNDKSSLTLSQSIEITYEIEEMLMEGYLRKIPFQQNGLLVRISNAIARKDHLQKIKDFKNNNEKKDK